MEWIKKEFPKATSDKTIGAYLNVLRTLKLIHFNGETVTLSQAGENAITSEPEGVILEQLKANIAGVSELIEKLKSKAMTREKVTIFSSKRFCLWNGKPICKQSFGSFGLKIQKL